jgi:hypothetical protein
MFVNVFVQDAEAKAREFLKQYPTTFPSGYDWPLAIATPLGFRGMPYTVLIGPDRKVLHKFHGEVTEAALVERIDRALTRR